ncbi:MAG: molybdenum cofactor guanylyltransferase [Solirubrobacteraceae bacterium]|nr:molybdenum cofactor guanylyltransferase [Solirubrobacteraceae bacterium]MDP4673521.1 molybdenum cofactor guanylyltransferase [Solirubrobacteraceae bacterium]MDP5034015.1 molybdenum cofactor guanylyltransferase [Solirubrobacteraceae bacterium]
MSEKRIENVIAAVLAGGSGSRIGGAKATAQLDGRALISYPLEAALGALSQVVVVAKADAELPDELGRGVELWIEPDAPRHPVIGVVEALRRAEGRAVVVIACDLPLLTSETVAMVARADAEGSLAVLASAAGRPQPLLARYEPAALEPLLGFDTDGPMTEQVMALMPTLIDVPAEASFNVNDLEQLKEVSRRLRSSSEQAE